MKLDPQAGRAGDQSALVEEILVRFIRNEITRTGFRRAVLGLSGGIDSSVAVWLAARALGPDNVLAVTMPYKTSSDANAHDSQTVIAALGVQTIDMPITPQIDAYFASHPEASRMRLANKCAPRADDGPLRSKRRLRRAGRRHEQQDRATLGLRHAVRRPGVGHQSARRSLQNAIARNWRATSRCRRRFSTSRRAAICGSGKPTKKSWA